MTKAARFLLFICAFGPAAKAQTATEYTKGYFRNPLNIPIQLAGNFGECRPNHFHSGLDIKTDSKENYPVHAAADGYISRIKMEKGGFGHALYVTHLNGFTTLYAHLNDFMPAVQQYLRQEQYKKESWEVDITLPQDKFPIRKGQQIAWSGNTGGSTAPHLHFEIRDTKSEHPVNPQLFGFDILDNIPPKPTQIAIYDLSSSIYEQKPQLKPLRANGNNYSIPGDTVTVNTALAGIGVNVFDYMNGSTNTLNFQTADVYMDEQLQSSVALENIGYEETRYLHAYADYKTRKQNGSWIQCLFRLPGNYLQSVFPVLNNNRGGLDLNDGQAHAVRVVLTDPEGNASTVSFYLKGSKTTTPQCEKQLLRVNENNTFSHPNVQFTLGDKALYDNVCFDFSDKKDANSFSGHYSLHHNYVPVHTYFDLGIKPDKPVPFDLRDKIALIYSDGKGQSGKAAIFDSGWYRANVRNFGTYWLVSDAVPPVIKTLQPEGANMSNATDMRFIATDAITSVKQFRVEVDGKWLCFEQKGNTFVYTFDEHCPKGAHQFVVVATDENGNKQTQRFTFIR